VPDRYEMGKESKKNNILH